MFCLFVLLGLLVLGFDCNLVVLILVGVWVLLVGLRIWQFWVDFGCLRCVFDLNTLRFEFVCVCCLPTCVWWFGVCRFSDLCGDFGVWVL